MAQKINVLLIDDIDGTDAVETIQFGLDGKTYEIDLNAEHAEALRAGLAPFVTSARKVGAKRSTAAPKAPSKAASSEPSDNAVIRAWATSKGIPVGVKGRIPADVRAQYEKESA